MKKILWYSCTIFSYNFQDCFKIFEGVLNNFFYFFQIIQDTNYNWNDYSNMKKNIKWENFFDFWILNKMNGNEDEKLKYLLKLY